MGRNIPLGLVLPTIVLVGASSSFASHRTAVGEVGPVFTRVSVDSQRQESPLWSDSPSLSADGRWVTFLSGTDLAGDGRTANGFPGGLFSRDLATGSVERISFDDSGEPVIPDSGTPASISGDGSVVLFVAPGQGAFVRDRATQTTEAIDGGSPGVSRNGRFIAYQRYDGAWEFYDRVTNLHERIDVSYDGNPTYPTGSAQQRPLLSDDGRYVVFSSQAWNLVPGTPTDSTTVNVYVRDRVVGETRAVNATEAGLLANRDSLNASQSADGRLVTFDSYADNLDPADANGQSDIFVKDLASGDLERIPGEGVYAGTPLASLVTTPGGPCGIGTVCGVSLFDPDISGDGRFVAFQSSVCCWNRFGLSGAVRNDVVVYDRLLQTYAPITLGAATTSGAPHSWQPSIDISGRFLAFTSDGGDLVAGDTNNTRDVFVVDRCPDLSCLAAPVTITIRKQTEPETLLEKFDFTAEFGNFQLGDGEHETFANLEPGEFHITEQPRSGWKVESIACTGALSQGSTDPTTGTVSAQVGPGGTLDCTFKNKSTEPTPTPVPPTKRVVVLISGINTNQTCDALEFERNQAWILSLLNGGSRGGRWMAAATLHDDQNFDFAFYGYSANQDVLRYCSSRPATVQYAKADTCWTIDDEYKSGEVKTTVGQAERFAQFIKAIITQQGENTLIDVVAFSQGGAISLYAYNAGLIDRDKINSIITFDGVNAGIGSGQEAALGVVNTQFDEFGGCGRGGASDPAYDSVDDMNRGSAVMRCIRQETNGGCESQSVPLYSMDSVPGALCPSGFSLDKEVHHPGYGDFIEVGGECHGNPWDNETLTAREGSSADNEKQRMRLFIGCAITHLFGVCEDLVNNAKFESIKPFEERAERIAVRPGSRTLTVVIQWPGSTVGSTLVSPSGVAYSASEGGIVRYDDAASTMWRIAEPEPGEWVLSLSGLDVPAEGEPVAIAWASLPDAQSDQDGDEIPDDLDSCPNEWNRDQNDSDSDGAGDACDDDDDNDGVEDATDNCRLWSNADQADDDENGLGDACDPDGFLDSDGDGVVDGHDNCPIISNPEQLNGDGDWLGDACEEIPATSTPTNTLTATHTPTATATSTVVRTPTMRPSTHTPSATPRPTRHRCADLDDDKRVTMRDVVIELNAIMRHRTDPKYDLNRDGRGSLRDLLVVIDQLGTRCPVPRKR